MAEHIKVKIVIPPYNEEKKKKTEEESIRERFELLYREIFFAKEQYFIFNDVCMNGYSEKYKVYNICIVDALEYSLLMKLAKIYDNDNNNDSVTLYYMLNAIQCNKKLNNNDPIIIKFAENKLKELENMNSLDKLKTLRDKNIAHLDKRYPEGMKSINKKNVFPYNDLETLINFAVDLIKNIFHLVYKEEILDDSQFKVLELEYNEIKKLQE